MATVHDALIDELETYAANIRRWNAASWQRAAELFEGAAAALRSVAAASLSDDERKALKFVADHCYGFLNARNIVYALLQRTERLLAAEPKCDTCGQVADGQAGEYPCAKCGRPTLHDAPDEPMCNHGYVGEDCREYATPKGPAHTVRCLTHDDPHGCPSCDPASDDTVTDAEGVKRCVTCFGVLPTPFAPNELKWCEPWTMTDEQRHLLWLAEPTYGHREVWAVEAAVRLGIVRPSSAPDGETSQTFIDIVFDGPPSHESGRFVECERADGSSLDAGKWIDRGNGLWALRIPLAAALRNMKGADR